jgi:hypothetical protein
MQSFRGIEPTGRYQVGFKTIKTKKGNFCAVFYPIDEKNNDWPSYSLPYIADRAK